MCRREGGGRERRERGEGGGERDEGMKEGEREERGGRGREGSKCIHDIMCDIVDNDAKIVFTTGKTNLLFIYFMP